MKNLFVIAGCNGAGKTTASYTILPEILDCREFVNADEIAKGLSPFQPEKAGIQAGRLMLTRIKSLLQSGENFAFETTLATRIYVNLIEGAKGRGYKITLLFFWLNSPDLAVKRVKNRVKEGGHNISVDIIRRRYESGLRNFFGLYKPIVNDWIFIDNSGEPYQIIAEGSETEINTIDMRKWTTLKTKYYGK